MAGIYVHIPFCKQACNYCNFHFSTSLAHKDALLEAILREIYLRKDYLQTRELATIYFGGGTPSLLSADEIKRITDRISDHFDINHLTEVTLEANPDDLTASYLSDIKQNTIIDRLSIGIQSFRDEDLSFMNRAHDANEAITSVKLAQDAGFSNLTIDLIYGTPGMNDEQWLQNLNQAAELDVQHLSCYALTLEPQTPLAKTVKKRPEFRPMEEVAERQFRLLMDFAPRHGFEQYEISNFAKDGQYARHNAAYWSGAYYLGIGAGAHSFNGHSRTWNVANNQQYIKTIAVDQLPSETEVLNKEDQYNEWILTRLRTKWGLDPAFPDTLQQGWSDKFESSIREFLENGLISTNGEVYFLTTEGKLMADYISAALFIE